MRRELVGFVAGVVLLAALLLLLDVREVAATVRRARLAPVLAAGGLGVGGVGLLGAALHRVRRSLDPADGGSPARFYPAFLRAYFVRLVVPVGSSGAPAIYAYVLHRTFDRPFESELGVATAAELLSYAASTGLALAGLAVLVVGGDGFAYDWALALGVGAILLAVVAGFGLLWRAPGAIDRAVRAVTDGVDASLGRVSERVHARVAPARVDRHLARFHETTGLLAETPRALLAGLVLSVLAWLALSIPLLLAVAALGASVPPALVFLAVPVSGFVYVLPVSGGLGGVEATLAGLLVVVAGLDVTVAAGAVLLHRLATYWTPLFVCTLAVVLGPGGVERVRPDGG